MMDPFTPPVHAAAFRFGYPWNLQYGYQKHQISPLASAAALLFIKIAFPPCAPHLSLAHILT
jgi:hypothetical protein